MKFIHRPSHYPKLYASLHSDCKNCCGLCCCALYCAKIDGFPENKKEGIPCSHLQQDFRCDMHAQLQQRNMKGCKAYECFGAGQKITQQYDPAHWLNTPAIKTQMYQSFQTIYRLQEILSYLLEAETLVENKNLDKLIQKYLEYAKVPIHEIASLPIDAYQKRVNIELKDVCKKLHCYDENRKNFVYLQKDLKPIACHQKDLSMCTLIGCDGKKLIADSLNFLGADIRDVDFSNADLRNTIFLTQRQLNSAKGNRQTKLPNHLHIPDTWLEPNQ